MPTATKTLLAILVLGAAVACAAPVEQPAEPEPRAPRDPQALEAIIAAIEAGWENADPAPFEQHYLDWEGARYIESGGQNVGLRDLIDNHVVPEGEFLESLELTFTAIETHFEDGFAWAVADVTVDATVKEDGRRILRRGHETFLFRDVGGEWKVVHTHSSTRPVEEE